MKSPFPGMDPYLEDHWTDVHASLIVYARDQLKPILPDDLQVHIEGTITVAAEDSGAHRDYKPDVRAYESKPRAKGRRGNGGTALVEPLYLPLRQEAKVRRLLRIIDMKANGRVVTAIEFLSPWNKLGLEARRAYRLKRKHLRQGKANFVEIDLHRTGPYILLARPNTLPPLEGTAYRACVWRAARPLGVEYYVLHLRNRLPKIRIPLRKADRDVLMELQTLVDEVYERGFAGEIEYTTDPVPPLPPADAAWADKLLRAKGLR